MRWKTYKTEREWLKGRDGSIGSSVTPALMGLVPDRGWIYYWMKMNPNVKAEADQGIGVNAELRRSLEPQIEKMLSKETGIQIHDPGHLILLSDEVRAHSSPDGLVFRDKYEKDRVYPDFHQKFSGMSEYKTVHWTQAYKWTEEPDLYALFQVMHGMAMPDCPWEEAWIGAIIGYGDTEDERRVFHVKHDDDLIDLIRNTWHTFFRFVDQDIMPPLDGLPSTERAIRLLYPASGRKLKDRVVVPTTFETEDATTEFLVWKAGEKEAKRGAAIAKQKVEKAMGEAGADVMKTTGGGQWSRTVVKRQSKHCPECDHLITAASEFTKITAPTRR